MIQTIDDAYFEEYISSTSTPIIIDFWAEWCGPCKMIAPVLEELDKDYGESIQIAKLNIDFNPRTPVQYDVRSIPTLIFFKGGADLGRAVGAVSKKLILDKLEHLQLL
jgi:thioredoxin 1